MSLEKLTIAANWTWQATDRWRTLETTMESGTKQYRGKGKRGRRFVLEFQKQNMSSTEAQALVDFYNAREGRLQPFRWDYKKADGETEELTVRFATDDLERRVFADTVYTFSVELEEQMAWQL